MLAAALLLCGDLLRLIFRGAQLVVRGYLALDDRRRALETYRLDDSLHSSGILPRRFYIRCRDEEDGPWDEFLTLSQQRPGTWITARRGTVPPHTLRYGEVTFVNMRTRLIRGMTAARDLPLGLPDVDPGMIRWCNQPGAHGVEKWEPVADEILHMIEEAGMTWFWRRPHLPQMWEQADRRAFRILAFMLHRRGSLAG